MYDEIDVRAEKNKSWHWGLGIGLVGGVIVTLAVLLTYAWVMGI